MDGGAGDAAAQASARLEALGYSDVATLASGLVGWKEAGRHTYSGVHVPSKAFGEFVEATYHTPSISAEDLQKARSGGANLVLLDSRPFDEFNALTIPGATNVPGAELVHRVRDLAPDPATTVVVNCAGRTRSIIGAQSLINAGLPNRVFALRNGTMGWELAGFSLEYGATRTAEDPSEAARRFGAEAAYRVAQRFGVRRVDTDVLRRWRDEADRRSLYVLDVRSPEEYAAGHLPGSINAPGGQLVQETDRYIAVRRGRIALIDDTRVRASMTASWLIQLGYPEVVVVRDALSEGPLEVGPIPSLPGIAMPEVPTVEPAAVADFLARGGVVVDVDSSLLFKRGHIPSARHSTRTRLPSRVPAQASHAPILVTSADGLLARFAAADLIGLGQTAAALAGGTVRWAAEGRPLEAGWNPEDGVPDDVWLKPFERDRGVRNAMLQYLSWEVDLVTAVRLGGLEFAPLPTV
jgi:rhodanese-related sulfurtransferase